MDAEGHIADGAGGVAGDEGSRGRYRILSQLGEGGMATVYLAVARGPSGFNKLVVLKALKPQFAGNPDFRKMFLREAQLAARLNHPGIVQTYEVIETVATPLIVMEYLDGQTLAKVRQRAKGDLALGSHLRIIADATAALHYAHELTDFDGRAVGLVHRDMTPHNVFVTFDGQVKLLDFGIAKLATSDQETEIGIIKGKLRYMPPEQLAGDPVDRRTDIYAAGVMLWEAATGQPLWKGCTDVVVMKHVLNGEIPSPRLTDPRVSEELAAICMKALSPAKADRYATAAELEAELDAFLDGLGSRVNGRSIGKYTSTLFADVRARTKALIETQLSQVALLPVDELETLGSEALESISLEAHGAFTAQNDEKEPPPATLTPPAATRAVPTMPSKRRSRRGLAIGAGAFALLGVMSVASALRSGGASSAPSPRGPVAASAAPAPAPSPVAMESVAAIRITATPPEAKVRLDGEPLPTNPSVTTVLADGTQHRVTAEAPGFETRSTAFLAERDTDVVVELERAKPPVRDEPPPRPAPNAAAPPPRPAPSAVVAPPAPGAPRATPARAVGCQPPYEIDGSGIKRFKVECL